MSTYCLDCGLPASSDSGGSLCCGAAIVTSYDEYLAIRDEREDARRVDRQIDDMEDRLREEE